MHVYKASKRGPGDDRCTPAQILVVAKHAADIKEWDLDPASNDFSIVPASVKWDGSSEDQDGLVQPWFGDVWLNFPFSCPDVWVNRAIKQSARIRHVRSVSILSPSDSSTAWWHQLRRACDAWSAWSGRIHFPLRGNPKGSPGGGVHLSYIGPRSNRWRRVFEHCGHVTGCGAIT